jgi:hypothetical protein
MKRSARSVTVFASLLVGAAAAATTPAAFSAPTTRPATGKSVDAGPAGGAGAVGTPEDVKAAYEKGDYKETLRLLGRVLSLKGKAAQGVDRYEMLMLRAESNLHLKANPAAIQALEEAIKVAPDDVSAAKARALVLLIKRSRGGQYTPKLTAGAGGDRDHDAKGPLDITDPDKREAAFKAVYAEEKVAARVKVQAAEKSKTLPPIGTALKSVVPLKDLEIAATGQTSETNETLNTLTDRAHKLMAKELDDMSKRTERIAARAAELIEYQYTRPDGFTDYRTRQRGLEKDDPKELKSIVEASKNVAATCKELTDSFASDAEPFEDLEDVAKNTAERADDVLKADYSRAR